MIGTATAWYSRAGRAINTLLLFLQKTIRERHDLFAAFGGQQHVTASLHVFQCPHCPPRNAFAKTEADLRDVSKSRLIGTFVVAKRDYTF